MATPSKGVMRPVMRSDIIRFKELARSGHSEREISRLTGRSRSTIRPYIKGLLVRSGPGNRMLAVLELAERSNKPLGALACDLGYAHAASLATTISNAKRLRAFKNGERASWR